MANLTRNTFTLFLIDWISKGKASLTITSDTVDTAFGSEVLDPMFSEDVTPPRFELFYDDLKERWEDWRKVVGDIDPLPDMSLQQMEDWVTAHTPPAAPAPPAPQAAPATPNAICGSCGKDRGPGKFCTTCGAPPPVVSPPPLKTTQQNIAPPAPPVPQMPAPSVSRPPPPVNPDKPFTDFRNLLMGVVPMNQFVVIPEDRLRALFEEWKVDIMLGRTIEQFAQEKGLITPPGPAPQDPFQIFCDELKTAVGDTEYAKYDETQLRQLHEEYKTTNGMVIPDIAAFARQKGLVPPSPPALIPDPFASPPPGNAPPPDNTPPPPLAGIKPWYRNSAAQWAFAMTVAVVLVVFMLVRHKTKLSDYVKTEPAPSGSAAATTAPKGPASATASAAAPKPSAEPAPQPVPTVTATADASAPTPAEVDASAPTATADASAPPPTNSAAPPAPPPKEVKPELPKQIAIYCQNNGGIFADCKWAGSPPADNCKDETSPLRGGNVTINCGGVTYVSAKKKSEYRYGSDVEVALSHD